MQQQRDLPDDLRLLLETGWNGELMLLDSPPPPEVLKQKGTVIPIPDAVQGVMWQQLNVLSESEGLLQQRSAPQLLALAGRSELPGLKELCERHKAGDLSTEDTVLALRHSCEHLRKRAFGFIARYTFRESGCGQYLGPLGEICLYVAPGVLGTSEARFAGHPGFSPPTCSVEELRTQLASGMQLSEKKNYDLVEKDFEKLSLQEDV